MREVKKVIRRVLVNPRCAELGLKNVCPLPLLSQAPHPRLLQQCEGIPVHSLRIHNKKPQARKTENPDRGIIKAVWLILEQIDCPLKLLVSILDQMSSAPSLQRVALYLAQHKAATAWILHKELDMPEVTVYRCLKKLKSLNLIHSKKMIPPGKHGGRWALVYHTSTASSQDLKKAMLLHANLLKSRRVRRRMKYD